MTESTGYASLPALMPGFSDNFSKLYLWRISDSEYWACDRMVLLSLRVDAQDQDK